MELKPYLKILVHAFIWMAFILIPLMAIPEVIEVIDSEPYFLYFYLGASIISIVIFYVIYGIAIPRFFLQKKYLKHILFVSALLFVSLFLSRILLLNTITIDPSIELSVHNRRIWGAFIPKIIIVLVASHTIGIYKKYKEIEIEKTRAQLKLLKAQINPHFLFNTLNGLYGLAIIKSDKTAKGISQLASIMRYVMTETEQSFVPLKLEVDYILNYVNLQILRLTEKTQVNINVIGDSGEKKIIPLLLITYLENAFKFGVSTEVESVIEINMEISDDMISFHVRNNKINSRISTEESNKIGLANAQKRLELMYKNNYELSVEESREHYEIRLKLFFQK